MKEIKLFLDKTNHWVSNIEILETLKEIEANNCDILYIHSALSFGNPNSNLKRQEILQSLYDVIMALNVRTICMPTFTFSFCNGLAYNPETSISKMGILNEFFRKQKDVIRSNDPLLSVALNGVDKDLVERIGKSSIGANSTFDKIRHRKNVKFLFFGPKIGDCLTYMHYLEWLYSCDYRYDRSFIGDVIINGQSTIEEYNIFVRYKGVIPNTASYKYEQIMYDSGLAKIVKCGNSTISIVDKEIATKEYKNCLDESPFYFVDFEYGKLVKDKTFIMEKEMVAL